MTGHCRNFPHDHHWERIEESAHQNYNRRADVYSQCSQHNASHTHSPAPQRLRRCDVCTERDAPLD